MKWYHPQREKILLYHGLGECSILIGCRMCINPWYTDTWKPRCHRCIVLTLRHIDHWVCVSVCFFWGGVPRTPDLRHSSTTCLVWLPWYWSHDLLWATALERRWDPTSQSQPAVRPQLTRETLASSQSRRVLGYQEKKKIHEAIDPLIGIFYSSEIFWVSFIHLLEKSLSIAYQKNQFGES